MTISKEIARKFCVYERIQKEFNLKQMYLHKVEEKEDENSSFFTPVWEKVEKENYSCSTKQLTKVIDDYPRYVLELIESGHIKKLVLGEQGKTSTRYEILKDFEIDMKDPVISREVERIRMKEQLRFLKTNKPDNFRFLGLTNLSSEILQSENESYPAYMKRLGNYQAVINEMQKGCLLGHVSVGGRVFSGFTSLPKTLRRFLVIIRPNQITGKIEFRKVVEIDINATIPRLLGCSIEEIIAAEYRNAKIKHEKGKMIREISLFKLKDGEVTYTDFTLNLLNEVKEYDLLIDENDTYMNIIQKFNLDVDRDTLKGWMLKLVFGTRKDDSKKDLKYLKFVGLFESTYPNLYDFIKASNQKYRNNKNQELRSLNENTITSKIFKIESKILNATMLDLDIDRLTLFDGVYVDEENKDMIIQRMTEKFEEISHRKYKGKCKEIEREQEEKEKDEERNVEERNPGVPTRQDIEQLKLQRGKSEQIVPEIIKISPISQLKLNQSNSRSSVKATKQKRESIVKATKDGRWTIKLNGKQINSLKNETLEQFKERGNQNSTN